MPNAANSTVPAANGNAAAQSAARGRDLRPLRWLLGFLRPYRAAVAGAVVALTVAAGTVLALGRGLASLIDRGFSTGDAALVDHAVLLLFGVTVVLAVASFARVQLVSWVGERVVADLRRVLFDHVVRLSPAYFEATRTGETLSRLMTDTSLVQTVIGPAASTALRNLLLSLGGLGLLVATSPRLTGLVLTVVPVVIGVILMFGRRVRRLSRLAQDRLAEVSGFAEEALGAIRTVQAFAHEALDSRRFTEHLDASVRAVMKQALARSFLVSAIILLVFGAVSVILWLGGHDVLQGRLSPGELSAFVFYAVVVASSAGALTEVVADLQRAAGAMDRLMQLLAMKPEIAAPATPVPLPRPTQGAIRFDHVRFYYPTRPDRPALDGFDLTVRPGETLAIVGPSGAGKTTVFQLLLRFYDPEAGSLSLDGVDLRQAAPADLRARIGLVPQDPVIFAADAAENIRYGRPDASDAEVRAAAEAAHAVEFLDRLPRGFATPLGERGVKLSAGQRQRLAIARAVLRDPALLLLDEATSALDAESEHLVQEALERLRRGRTTLVIAHRLATVLNADRIAVMEAGRIVAQGSHADLIREGGLYARLAALQFKPPEEPSPAAAR